MSEETTPQVVIEDDPIEVRKNKRQALIDAGEQPYGRAYEVTDHVEDLDARYADIEDGVTTEDRVVIAGRLMSKRNQGKIIFGELRDATGDIQLFCRINALGEEAFDRMKDLDVGDWIGVEGVIMRTRRGQLSVGVDKFELLSKSLRPLPEKFHGLADKEIRYRQRYVDLIINPEVKDTFAKRSKIVSAIRRYMEEQGFMEVETPFLHSIMGGANAKPFTTHFNALDRDFYLRIATELPLKRLLVGGFEKVFEIGRQFRNEGMDPYHNPEFTTMEAYQAFTDIDGMMDLTQGYIQAAAMAACGTLQVTYQGQEIDLSGEWPRRTMAGLASEYSGEEVSFDRTREDLVAILEKNGGHAEAAWGKGKLIAEIFEAVAEEKLIQPTFVIDHPLEVSPLAKKKPSDPNFTDRFELFIVGHEYANAFTELNDPIDQAERFQAQVEAKGMGDDEAMGFDHDYIRALEYGMPPAGGVGIGIDRLVMLLTDSPTIRDVLLFPAMREEKNAAAPAPKKAAPAPAPAPVAAPVEAAPAEAPAEAPAAEFAPVAEGPLTATITREDALELLKKYNQEPFHIQHGLTVEGCMRWFANELGHGENVDFWGLVGLLHDVDFEMWPTEHCQKAPELLREAGVSEDMIRAICSHGFGHCSDIEPLHEMEKVLFAVDELTGLIWSYALMRPTKSVEGMELKSLKKKFKDKRFAAGCSRDVIREGAERLGWELDELFTKAIAAMQSCEASVASAMEA